MKDPVDRREFIKTAVSGSVTLGVAGKSFILTGLSEPQNKRIGIIGLNTSHSVAFTKALNDPAADPAFLGHEVVAAFPKGSNDIKSSVDRIPGYTEDVKKLGVEILFTVMGTVCKLVTRSSTHNFDKVTGVWNDDRIGTFRFA